MCDGIGEWVAWVAWVAKLIIAVPLAGVCLTVLMLIIAIMR